MHGPVPPWRRRRARQIPVGRCDRSAVRNLRSLARAGLPHGGARVARNRRGGGEAVEAGAQAGAIGPELADLDPVALPHIPGQPEGAGHAVGAVAGRAGDHHAVLALQCVGQAGAAQGLGRGLAITGGVQQLPQVDADLGYWFSDIRAPYFAGCCGSPGVITDAVGARNIFVDTTEEWPQVSWEVIAERDPDVLVLADLSRRTIDGDALDAKIAFLESNPVTRNMTAVQQHRYVVLTGSELDPGIRQIDAVEKLADGFAKIGEPK